MKLNPDQRHALDHARYICARATDQNPEVCFDYEVVQALVDLIEELIELRDVER